ncbi:hypothetical protein HAX54_018452, partial [Datura stramonium]|nr:hypothetical protein [Datura stramonium]
MVAKTHTLEKNRAKKIKGKQERKLKIKNEKFKGSQYGRTKRPLDAVLRDGLYQASVRSCVAVLGHELLRRVKCFPQS